MTLLLEENAKCKDHKEICEKCFERYLLFKDVAVFTNNTHMFTERKKELLPKRACEHWNKDAKIHCSSSLRKVSEAAIPKSLILVTPL